MDYEYDVLGGYVPSFVQHLKDTGARLGLRIGSHANKDRISAGGAIEEVVEAHTHSSWTPAENDAFFRAISVHSRWRPDLIAACVPTRTEWEVWMYLEALEEGAATLVIQRGGEDVDMEDGLGDERRDVEMQADRSSSDSRSHSGSDMDEDVCEPALEVSQAWIDAEERMASWIVDEEHLASVEGDAAADTGEVVDEGPKRKRGRPRGAGQGRAQNRAREQTVSNKDAPSPVHRSPTLKPTSMSARKPSRDPSALPERKREALMGRLEGPHLLVLDGILRDSEAAMKEKSRSREGSATAAAPTEHGNEGPPRDVQVSNLSDRIAGPQGTSNTPESPSNAVIDPVLLALSGGADPAERQLGQVPSESTLTSCAPTRAPAQGSSSFPNASSQPASVEVSSQPGTGNMFTFPQDKTALTNPDPNVNVESDLSLFSPRSRRRIQKRLYMRRKRALRENGAEGAVDTGIEKLKPGKKAKTEQRETSAVSTSVPCSEPPSDAEVELPENMSKKNKPGLTLPYKLKAQFAELGVDAAYLRGQGMDLLNLGALGRLMGLWSSLEHGEEEVDGSAIAESIDAELIRHLQAAMVSFVTDMIHRAIVWREREIRLKQRSRAWRPGDQVTTAAVEHAVEAIGARYHSHKAYFKSLEAFHGPSTEPSNAAELNPTDPAPVLSPHREVYTPLIHPPSGWRISPLACLARTYEREATRTRRGTSAEEEEEEVMSDETDEEKLAAELKDEDEADILDMELAVTHEQHLWNTVRRK